MKHFVAVSGILHATVVGGHQQNNLSLKKYHLCEDWMDSQKKNKKDQRTNLHEPSRNDGEEFIRTPLNKIDLWKKEANVEQLPILSPLTRLEHDNAVLR
jgi:hypothetical protein